jgi:hypothetical protein
MDSTTNWKQRVVLVGALCAWLAPGAHAAAMHTDEDHLWPDGVIPYVMAPGMHERAEAAIRKAMEMWSARTVIRFREARPGDFDMVVFSTQQLVQTSFATGIGNRGGPVDVIVSTAGGTDSDGESAMLWGALHELGHAIGLHHEHQRPDRDDYVRVDIGCSVRNPGTVGAPSNYARVDARMIGPYDFRSIMHYSSLTATEGPPWDRTTCTAIERRDTDSTIRGGREPSFWDAVAVNTAYRGVVGDLTVHDNAGHAVAVADFDGDGWDEIAVGEPGSAAAGFERAGRVHVLEQDGTVIDVLMEGYRGLAGRPEIGAAFGASLAAGDFDGQDGIDLAIGAPGADLGRAVDAGRLHVVYGPISRRETLRTQLFHQDSPRLDEEGAESGDAFAWSLAADDLDGDGIEDLVVGTPFEDFGPLEDVGTVNVVPGSPDGLVALEAEQHYQDSVGVSFPRTVGARFGWSLATGDFDCNNVADIAVGSPGHTVFREPWAGLVTVVHRTSRGDILPTTHVLHESLDVFRGRARAGDEFGHALAAGHFDDGGRRVIGCADLAIGIPGQDVDDSADRGLVQVLFTTRTGDVLRAERWDQRDTGRDCQDGERCSARPGERFGSALATGDFEGDGFADLAISALGEDLPGAPDECPVILGTPVDCRNDAGIVQVLRGSALGMRADEVQAVHQDVHDTEAICTGDGCFLAEFPVEGDAADAEHFGASLATGDLDGDGRAELVIGIPGELVGEARRGGVQVIQGGEADRFPGDDDRLLLP